MHIYYIQRLRFLNNIIKKQMNMDTQKNRLIFLWKLFTPNILDGGSKADYWLRVIN